MVDAAVADDMATALGQAPVPDDPLAAERTLAFLLSTRLPVLEQAPFTERAKAALRRVLREAEDAEAETDDPWGIGPTEGPAPDGEQRPQAGDLARAVLLLAADRPRLFRGLSPPTSSASPSNP